MTLSKPASSAGGVLKPLNSRTNRPIIRIIDFENPENDGIAALQKLLSTVEQNCKLVVISVAGRRRDGKSFLLNFFLRYLRAHRVTNRRRHWMEHDTDEEHVGFDWKRTAESVTRGILIWPQLFKIDENTAVMLMDTQGIFDEESTQQTDTHLFCLSLLLSSVQIFNVKGDLDRDHLKNLEIFTEIARYVSGSSSAENSPPPFQKLIFLLRDWENSHEFDYGWTGGRGRLDKCRSGASASTLDRISKCFERKLQGFLMPRPGDAIVEESSRKLADVKRNFKDQVKNFVEEILLPGNLELMKFGGAEITCGAFAEIAKRCIGDVRNGRYPIVRGVASSVAFDVCNKLVDEYVEEYKEAISKLTEKCPFERSSFSSHLENKSNEILEKFRSCPKIEVAEATEKASEDLRERIESLNRNFETVNATATWNRGCRIVGGAAIVGAATGAPLGPPGIAVGVAAGVCVGGAVLLLKPLPELPVDGYVSGEEDPDDLLLLN